MGPTDEPALRVAFPASHGGSGFAAVVAAVEAGRLSGVAPVLLISNNSAAEAMERARAARVPRLHLSRATHPDPEALDLAICRALDGSRADIVLLAGYVRKLGPEPLRRYDGRVLNCHPALLPRFGGPGMYGRRVHEAVRAARETVTGATVHQVDGEYDHRPVLAYREVRVRPDDTPASLEVRVKEAEASLLVETLRGLRGSPGLLKAPSPAPCPGGGAGQDSGPGPAGCRCGSMGARRLCPGGARPRGAPGARERPVLRPGTVGGRSPREIAT